MLRIVILLCFLAVTTLAYGQALIHVQALSGKTFLSSRSAYLKVLNDTTLHSSINEYNDTALFFLRNDTLYIKQKYVESDQTGTKRIERLYDYKVIKLAPDTLILKNNYRFEYKPDDWEDTLVFINIDRAKEPVEDFKFLKLQTVNPWSGERHISIDRLGSVNFDDVPLQYSVNHPRGDKTAKPRRFKGQLTRKELATFKSVLSKSLPSKLPLKRGCPMDGAMSNFEIRIGERTIKSTGCDLTWTQIFLSNYLYEIDHNKGFVRATGRPTTHNKRLPK